MHKIRVYHFHNGSGGGVLSVIKNLLQFSANPAIENHIIHVVNKNLIPDYCIEPIIGAHTQQVLFYASKDNFYLTSKRLARLLPDDKAVIVAHDWVELGMASNLGLQNPVLQFLHGDYPYYYELSQKNQSAIDRFVPIAASIYVKLQQLLPQRKTDIRYLRFPVAEVPTRVADKTVCSIIFIGRLSEEKGYPLLPQIAAEVAATHLQVHWHIIGAASGNLKDISWPQNTRVHFYGPMPNSEVIKLLPGKTFILLPSRMEGMPVVLVEAMKAGVVPLASDIEGGIQELIINGVTGFKFGLDDVAGYAQTIRQLFINQPLLQQMSENGIELANRLFNPYKNTIAIETLLLETAQQKKIKYPRKVYGSRLDQKWVPGFFTVLLRKIVP